MIHHIITIVGVKFRKYKPFILMLSIYFEFILDLYLALKNKCQVIIIFLLHKTNYPLNFFYLLSYDYIYNYFHHLRAQYHVNN